MLLGISTRVLMACDICGCSLGGLSYGILNQHYQDFIGLRYSHAKFNAFIDHNSQYLEPEFSEDTYQRMEILGRIGLTERLSLNLQLPYLSNNMDGSHQKVKSSGLGDPTMMLYFSPKLKMPKEESLWSNVVQVGVGLKLPLGEHQKEDNGVIINRNFQMGSGSLDYIFSTNYTLNYSTWAVNLESSYKLNSKNNDDYKIGNQFNYSVYLLKYLTIKDKLVLPFAGVYHESAARHKEGNYEEFNTGGRALFATIGTQVTLNRITLNFQYQSPLNQNYNSESIAQIQSNDRFSIGLLFSFLPKVKLG